jgi:hypothetical protein
VSGGWRKLYNKSCAHGGGEGVYNILIGRPEGRRPLGRPRRRWEDNILMDLRETGFGDVD